MVLRVNRGLHLPEKMKEIKLGLGSSDIDRNAWYEQLLRQQITQGLKPIFIGDAVRISKENQNKYDINHNLTFIINLPVPTQSGFEDLTQTLYIARETYSKAAIYQLLYCDLELIYQSPSTSLLEKLLKNSNVEIEAAMRKRKDL